MEPNETTPDEMPWKDAIIKVLQDDDRPLHYREIAQFIGDRGLRSRIGATPWNTVSKNLSSMVNQDDKDCDGRIHKADNVEKGYYEYVTFDSPADDDAPLREDSILDDEEQDRVRVGAFGLYWERKKIGWKTKKILGRQGKGSQEVNFANQQGVYLLHNRQSVAYVGRTTTGSLYQRLSVHNKDRKSMRWDSFSWFGFRDVKDNGELNPMPDQVDSTDLISILETVLIEALEPPVNGRRGDSLGSQYQQVQDPDIVKELMADQSLADLLQSLAG